MKIVVGLGNPGESYRGTPHNAGFQVVDRLAAAMSCRLRRSVRQHALVGDGRLGGEAVALVKPQTYMNDSGRAVAAALRYRNAGAADLLVVLDDADLPLGTLRIRSGGSSGGHRGLRSIVEALGTDAFARVRLGIGRRGGESLAEHVLSPLGAAEASHLERVVARAEEAVRLAIESGVAAAMNAFNGVVPAASESDAAESGRTRVRTGRDG